MIKIDLYIKEYDWDLTFLFKANRLIAAVENLLFNRNCPFSIVSEALRTILHINTGFCYTNYYLKSTLICVAETDSEEELVNTAVHELKHFQSHVCEYYEVDEKSEEAAYLIGDTTGKLYKEAKRLCGQILNKRLIR